MLLTGKKGNRKLRNLVESGRNEKENCHVGKEDDPSAGAGSTPLTPISSFGRKKKAGSFIHLEPTG